jgi:hypothetical protein
MQESRNAPDIVPEAPQEGSPPRPQAENWDCTSPPLGGGLSPLPMRSATQSRVGGAGGFGVRRPVAALASVFLGGCVRCLARAVPGHRTPQALPRQARRRAHAPSTMVLFCGATALRLAEGRVLLSAAQGQGFARSSEDVGPWHPAGSAKLWSAVPWHRFGLPVRKPKRQRCRTHSKGVAPTAPVPWSPSGARPATCPA